MCVSQGKHCFRLSLWMRKLTFSHSASAKYWWRNQCKARAALGPTSMRLGDVLRTVAMKHRQRVVVWHARALAWIVCAGCCVALSTSDSLRDCVRLAFDACRIPAWLWTLPFSLSAAWAVAQLVLLALNIPRLSPRNKAVFITGCDSGFGFHLALRLYSRGFYVFAACLHPNGDGAVQLRREAYGIAASKLRSTASSDELPRSKDTTGQVHDAEDFRPELIVVACDVTDEKSLAAAVADTQDKLKGRDLWALVANAGLGCYGFTEWVTMERINSLFEVNTFGVLKTFRAFAPLLRNSKGRLVVTTSLASRVAPPTLVPYSMTKYAARALCDGLRSELAPFGIHVCSIEPNMYRTSIIPTTTKELDLQWAGLSDEQKGSYGKNLLKRSRIMTQDFSYLCQSDLRFPLWCFEHAITSPFPKPSYQCDRFPSWMISKLIALLPEEFSVLYYQHIHHVLALGRNVLSGRYV